MKQTNIKEKIEEILHNHNVETIKLVGVNDPTTMYVSEVSTGILEELTTLYTETVEVELRGFAEWVEDKYTDYGYKAIFEMVKQYLLKRNKK